jgi:hypothetical protein
MHSTGGEGAAQTSLSPQAMYTLHRGEHVKTGQAASRL